MSDNKENPTVVTGTKKKKSKIKLLLKILVVLVVLLMVAVGVLCLTYDKIVSKAVSTIGSTLTGTEVKLESFSLSPFKGSVTIGGFSVANPQGYQTPYAIKVKELYVSLDPSTILKDEIVVNEIKLSGLAISYEQGLTGNNLSDIKNNLDKMSSGEKAEPKEPAKEEKPGKKVKVTVINFVDGEITVAAKSDLLKPVTIPMVDTSIHPSKTMSWAELGSTMWDGLYSSVTSAVSSSADIISSGGKKVYEQGKETGKKLLDSVKSVF